MPNALDVALATCAELPEPDPDRELLSAALAAAGVRAAWLAWDDPTVDWATAKMTVLRSTWNYPQKFEAFQAWLDHVASVSRLENPLPLVRGNLHKGYLADLERQGIPVPPTELVVRGSDPDLSAILRRDGWARVVLKPAVSAASWRTLRVDAANLDEGAGHLRRLSACGDALVQAYLPSVEGYGERAIVVIDGEPTHAVRKTPRFGGEDEAVSETRVPISPDERALVARIVARWPAPPLYARIDLAPGPRETPVVMELELVEPSLFFAQNPQALQRFVAAVVARRGQTMHHPIRAVQ